MKKALFYFLMVSLTGLIIISCEKKNEPMMINGKLINSSTCKNGFKSDPQPDNTPDTISCIEYSYDNRNHTLTIKHINAAFNCCPEKVFCNITLAGDTIIVEETEKSALCNCDCLYDLDIEVNDVEAGSFTVSIIEPYAGDMEKLEFDIDLLHVTNGSFCVTRKQYPYGIISSYE